MYKNSKKIVFSILILAFFLVEAKAMQLAFESESNSMALPPVIIYKTKKDYSHNVAIGLSEDKKSIVSYPHPRDVSEASVPTKLKKKYWLDNRGIGTNVAFLSITYEQYAQLSSPLSLEEMMKMIIDSDPLLEMYACPPGTDRCPCVLNEIIKNGFKETTKLR
ncbi:MAG: hypothetical protein LBR36_01865 [Bacteroidales bacterium]|jgi:hypothetical protein|nr:hypothetical protein [Bacteroidales bacterium]